MDQTEKHCASLLGQNLREYTICEKKKKKRKKHKLTTRIKSYLSPHELQQGRVDR